MAPTKVTSIWARRLDLFYIAYILSAAIFPFLLDFAVYYPVDKPHWSTNFLDWMLREIDDPLYQQHHPFLEMYTAIEALYLLPHGFWCIRGLLKDDAMVPFHLLIWSWYMVQSCAVCGIEVWAAKDWPRESVNKATPGYVVFFIIGFVMFADSATRVRSVLLKKQKTT
ncbi:transmembrane protein 6/97 [Xylariales sp. PMI_506]|nr:transmembrane protein 6/97 [Xylariales sp. PMI_506]